MSVNQAAANSGPLQKETNAAAVKWGGLFTGAILLILLTVLVAELDDWIAITFKDHDVTQNPLEYPLTAVVIGLIANALLRVTNLYQFVKPAIRTELFLKVGLVILGARISLDDLVTTGTGGLIQALIMVCSVFMFTWWLGGRLKLNPTLRAVMASAVSVCGVSAAIAAAGSVLARKEEVTYVTALVIIVALPMMVLMPPVAHALGLSDEVAGAWFGGNIDTTAAVVGAGTIFSDDAQAVAAIVKLGQNVMIGFVAFALALYFATVIERDKETAQKPSVSMIWQRFPKFVIGFVLVSILVSADAFSLEIVKELNSAAKWIFALAFVAIGLDFHLSSLREMGWRPVGVFMGATVFNTALALLAAWLIFGVLGF